MKFLQNNVSEFYFLVGSWMDRFSLINSNNKYVGIYEKQDENGSEVERRETHRVVKMLFAFRLLCPRKQIWKGLVWRPVAISKWRKP